ATPRQPARPSAGGRGTAVADTPAPAPVYDEGIFELVVTGAAERPELLVLVDESGRVLIPLDEVLALAEVPVDREAGALVLTWPRSLRRPEPSAWAPGRRPGSRRGHGSSGPAGSTFRPTRSRSCSASGSTSSGPTSSCAWTARGSPSGSARFGTRAGRSERGG